MYIDHTAEPRGRVLKFQFLIQDYSPSLTLKWGASLTDFTPRLTTVGEIDGVSARVWVDSLKMEFVIALNWDFDRAAFNLSIAPGAGEIGDLLAPGKTTTIKPTSYATAPRKILTELLPKLNNRLTGSGSTIGDPRIKASRVVNLEGLGDQFGGLYRITSTTHTLDCERLQDELPGPQGSLVRIDSDAKGGRRSGPPPGTFFGVTRRAADG